MQTPEILRAEIKTLSQKLEAKKLELAHRNPEIPEKEIFHSVMAEHIGQEAKTAATRTNQPVKSETIPAEIKQNIDNLILTALDKGIKTAVADAKKANDPYLLDLLHDSLADHYYEKLVASRQIKLS